MTTKTTTTSRRQSSGSMEQSSSAWDKLLAKVPTPPALISASLLFLLDIAFRRTFRWAQLSFPSSLAGCGVVLTALLTLPPATAQWMYGQLQPGAALLAKWLPVFFVPSLVTLPLSGGLGSAAEVLKVGTVIVGGFLFTLLSTALSVVLVRKLSGDSGSKSAAAAAATGSAAAAETVMDAEIVAEEIEEEKKDDDEASPPLVASSAPAKSPQKGPYSNALFYTLSSLTAATFLPAAAANVFRSATYATPLTSVFLLLTTLTTFVYGTRLPKAFTKWIHPLITCTTLTWTTVASFTLFTATQGFRSSFRALLRRYRTGNVIGGGAGDLLLFCLGPAVVSLAVSMYERRRLMRDNLSEVGVAIGTSTVGGVFGTAAAVHWLEIGNPAVRLALLSRNITSPLAMAMASLLGADVSLAVSMVVVTGLLGANFGASILSAVGIADPVARGLGMGAAAHGLGTAAIVSEEDAFPFSAIAMALTASAATVLVSIPLFQRMILQLALGSY